MNRLPSRDELKQLWIRTVLTYTDDLSYFGPASVALAWAIATATLVLRGGVQLYAALLRRLSVMAADDDSIEAVGKERGAGARLGGQRAQMLVVVRPERATVTGIATADGSSTITVDDAGPFEAGQSIRIRHDDGTSEVRTITSIDGADLIVPELTEAYDVGDGDTVVLLRVTIPAGSTITTRSGALFRTLDTLIAGDANPVLAGESASLALADKVWVEAVETGTDGNVAAGSVVGFEPAIDGVLEVTNPEAARGGDTQESLLDYKDRIIHGPAKYAQETLDWFEARLREANPEVLRAIPSASTTIGEMHVRVLRRNGGTFGAEELAAMEEWLGERVRSHMTVRISNVELTAIECEYEITLTPNTDLRTVYVAAADALAAHLDYRRWPFGEDVDDSALLAAVRNTDGIATLSTATALPDGPVTVDEESLPHLVRLSLHDRTSGRTINETLAQRF